MFHREGICYNVVNVVSDELAEVFRKTGVEVVFFDISPWLTKEPDETLLSELVNSGFDAALAVNAVGQECYSIGGKNIYDLMDITFYNYILDHPIAHQVDLKQGPSKYEVICMDRHHCDFIGRCFPNIRGSYFLPLGGCDDGNAVTDLKEKEYDLVYTGTRMRLDEMEDKITAYPPAIRKLTLACIEYMLDNRQLQPDEALEQVLNNMGLGTLSGADFLNYAVATAIANRYLCAYVREELIRYLASSDIRLHVFGNGWDDIAEESTGNTVFHEPVDYRETAEIYKRSKLVLNVMPFFRDGSHDRIPTSLLNGAAVLTDHSKYLDETMTGKLYFYDISKPWETAAEVKRILSDETGLAGTISAGYAYASENMTWNAAGKKLLDIMNKEEVK